MSTKHEALFNRRREEFAAMMPGSTYNLLLRLAVKVNAEGVAEGYTKAAMARDIGCHAATVKTGLRKLVGLGLVQKEPVFNTGYCRYTDRIILHLEPLK